MKEETIQINTLQPISDCLVPELAVNAIKDLNQILWQRTLGNYVHIISQLGKLRRANNDRVALCAIQNAVVRGPSESGRVAGDAMLGCRFFGLVRGGLDLGLVVEGCIELADVVLAQVVQPPLAHDRKKKNGARLSLTDVSNRPPD